MTSDGDLIPVTRGDLLMLWLLAQDGLEDISHTKDSTRVLITPWVEEQQELLKRTAEKLGNPCQVCHMTGGARKFSCSES